MNRYFSTCLVLVLVCVVILCVGSYIKAQEATAPDSVTVPGGSFGKVTFNHKLHAESAGCKECHHMGEVTQKCNSCHTAEAAKPSKDAFHANCIECHKAKEKGPTGCMDCHKKE
ncbi:MAG: cytochrome c3 family protein [Candidatus Omnitrophica bacterium]|nr:cytochrome c3 family protein [Candidatus Omnitrophota bacterium]